MNTSRRSIVGAALCAALGGWSATAGAAGYPERPVKIVVGFAAGGGADIVARQLGAKLGDQTGQQFLVDNRAGATGTIAAASVAKSPADGYTLMLCSQSTMVLAPALYPKLPFDPVKDFVPVTQLVNLPMLLVVHPDTKAKDVAELLALMRSGNVSYASAGLGGPQHVAGALFEHLAKAKLTHVPYKGDAPALTDLMGGQVTMMFANLPVAWPYVKAGKLRVLAISSAKRDPAHPEIPTIAEAANLPDFDVQTWYGLFAPAGTPEAVTRKLAEEATRAMRSPELNAKMTEQGYSVVASDTPQFQAFVKTEVGRWGGIVKDINIKAD
jgi:tripartite-type tricarboxylate transporter receptor subunit TctC